MSQSNLNPLGEFQFGRRAIPFQEQLIGFARIFPDRAIRHRSILQSDFTFLDPKANAPTLMFCGKTDNPFGWSEFGVIVISDDSSSHSHAFALLKRQECLHCGFKSDHVDARHCLADIRLLRSTFDRQHFLAGQSRPVLDAAAILHQYFLAGDKGRQRKSRSALRAPYCGSARLPEYRHALAAIRESARPPQIVLIPA